MIEASESDILTARGVSSPVRDPSGDALHGHALLMDYDDGSSYDRLMDDSKDLPGLTVVLRSSPESWHVHNTTVRPLNETALEMLATKCDPTHISVGYRRGQWTIRIGPKTQANASEGSEVDGLDEPYKSAPEPLNWWVNRTDEPQSRPHMKLLAAMMDESDLGISAKSVRDRARSRCPRFVGTQFRAEEYATMTDELKHG